MNPPRNRPLVIGHRGASGHAVENSLEAFRKAAELGAEGVELDVHATRDGRIVVFHDDRLPGIGPIAGLSSEAARRHRLRNGEPVPFLEEVLKLIPSLFVFVEVKGLDPVWDERFLELIAAAPAPDRCAVHSFDHRIIARLGEKRPSLSRGVLSTSYPVDPIEPLRLAGADTLWQERQLIDRPLVAQVHQAGCRIVAWTVNDAGAAAALSALGVDGLCGNYPERLSSP